MHWAKAALDALPAAELNWRSVCVGALAVGEYVTGRLRNAHTLLVEAQALCAQTGNHQFERATAVMLDWVLVEQNQPQRATPLLHQALATARAVGDLDDTSNALNGLAEIALCEHDLDAAWAQASEVVEATRQYPHQDYYVQAALMLARVEQARGDLAAAQARCAALLHGREPASRPVDQQLVALITYEQARIALGVGDLTAVRRWRDTRSTDLELPRAQRDREELLIARLLATEGDPAAAVQCIQPLLAAAEADGRARVALELRVSLALTFAANGQPHDARHALAAAIASAQPANAQHIFLAEGETLAPLLRATLPSLTDRSEHTFAKAMLQRLDPTGEATASDLLSPQERRVLRLLAAGRNNTEIATELIISVNTVKVHVKSIYRKLNVTSRLAAARAARVLNLL